MSQPDGTGEYIGKALEEVTRDKEQLDGKVDGLEGAIKGLEDFLDSTEDFYAGKGDELGGKLSSLRDALSLVYSPMVDKETRFNGESASPPVEAQSGSTIIIDKEMSGKEEKPPKRTGLTGVIAQYISKRALRGERIDPLDKEIINIGRFLQKQLNSIRNQHSIYQSIFLYFNSDGEDRRKARKLKTHLLKVEIKRFCDVLEPYTKACASYVNNKLNEASMRIAEAQARTLQAISYQAFTQPYAPQGFREDDLTRRRRQ